MTQRSDRRPACNPSVPKPGRQSGAGPDMRVSGRWPAPRKAPHGTHV
jgi:hypothetical protein